MPSSLGEEKPSVACLQAMYSDIISLYKDNSTADITIKCSDEGEIKVHSMLMMARSPVFHSMLTTEMKEKKEKIIVIEYWGIEVVQEMIKFIYTANISKAFDKIPELLILADKYCIESLVTLCSSLLSDSVSQETAVELGIFGETHGAKDLLEKCAWFISRDLGCIEGDSDWDRVKGSPGLATKILRNISDGRKSEVIVDRFGVTVRGTYGILGKRDAVQFRIETAYTQPIFLTRLGLFGTTKEETVNISLSVMKDKSNLTQFVSHLSCDGTMNLHMVDCPNPVSILPNVNYTIVQEIEGSGFTYQGQEGYSTVPLHLPMDTNASRIRFSKSYISSNGTEVKRGALPRLVFKTHV